MRIRPEFNNSLQYPRFIGFIDQKHYHNRPVDHT